MCDVIVKVNNTAPNIFEILSEKLPKAGLCDTDIYISMHTAVVINENVLKLDVMLVLYMYFVRMYTLHNNVCLRFGALSLAITAIR